MEHVTTTRVRFGETDKMGVVYHAHFIVYFEMGRTEYMRKAGLPYTGVEKLGYRLVVTDVGCRYRGNVGYDDVITIRTRVAGLGKATIRFEYTLEGPTGAVIAEGHTELASLDDRGKPVRLPKEIVRSLRPD